MFDMIENINLNINNKILYDGKIKTFVDCIIRYQNTKTNDCHNNMYIINKWLLFFYCYNCVLLYINSIAESLKLISPLRNAFNISLSHFHRILNNLMRKNLYKNIQILIIFVSKTLWAYFKNITTSMESEK